MEGFEFSVVARRGNAKAGRLVTPHGTVKTPVFMPVGTAGSVKALSPEDLRGLGAEIVLGNTYHLYLRPGESTVKKMGGLAEFTNWKGATLTDSGGFQVSSLGLFRESEERGGRKLKRTVITDEGVVFWSHLDGGRHELTPEKSVWIQEKLGADIIMAFDEATPLSGKKYAREAMERTHGWLERSISEWRKLESRKERGQIKQELFGIVQGGNYKDLRRESAKFVVSKELFGVAVGGGSIGRSSQETSENVGWIRDLLPKDRPIYLMGVGVGPREVIEAIRCGADMFDCVAPTRLARSGLLYSGQLVGNGVGNCSFESEFTNCRLNIAKEEYRNDARVVEEGCDCYTCTSGFSRAYLRHLFRSRELLYFRLASIHNLRVIIRVVGRVRGWLTESGGRRKGRGRGQRMTRLR